MKLSLCIGDLELRFGIERAFEMAKNAGFEAIDFNIDGYWRGDAEGLSKMRCYGMTDDEMRIYYKPITDAAKKYGLTIQQTHSIYATNAFFTNREDFDKITKKNIFETARLGAKYTVIHPPRTSARIYDEDYENNYAVSLEFYRSLIPDLKKHGVIAAIEPLYTTDADKNVRPSVCSRAEEINSLINDLGSEHFCCCADLGHLALVANDTGDSVGNAIRKFGKNLKVIHAHDINKNHDAHTKPFTYGIMDWVDIAKALKDINYEGTFNLEVGNNYYGAYPDEMIPESLRHMAEIAKYIIK